MLDRCFYIIQGLIDPIKVRVFVYVVINKKYYWHRHVPIQEIDNYRKTKKIGDVTHLRGKIVNYNDDTFFMNNPDYMIKLMSTYDGITVKNGKITEKNL